MSGTSLIVGAGSGLSASLARKLAARGSAVHLAARNTEKLAGLADETGATAHACDATDPQAVDALFAAVGEPDFVVYNASARSRGDFVDLDRDAVRHAIEVSAYAGFLIAHAAARIMVPRGAGAIFFTGASASVKGYAKSAPFAMGKFALRGLAQSMARELSPKGVHVAHFVIDGGIRSEHRAEPADRPDSMLDPDAIAETYMNVLDQDRSAWSWEIELRPWLENF